MIALSLPIPPSVNAMYRNVPKIGRVKTSVGKEWARQAGWMARKQLGPVKERLIPSGDVKLTILIERKKRHTDLDNTLKGILDLLTQMWVYTDDSQVAHIDIKWGSVEGCLVKVEAIGPAVMS